MYIMLYCTMIKEYVSAAGARKEHHGCYVAIYSKRYCLDMAILQTMAELAAKHAGDTGCLQ